MEELTPMFDKFNVNLLMTINEQTKRPEISNLVNITTQMFNIINKQQEIIIGINDDINMNDNSVKKRLIGIEEHLKWISKIQDQQQSDLLHKIEQQQIKIQKQREQLQHQCAQCLNNDQQKQKSDPNPQPKEEKELSEVEKFLSYIKKENARKVAPQLHKNNNSHKKGSEISIIRMSPFRNNHKRNSNNSKGFTPRKIKKNDKKDKNSLKILKQYQRNLRRSFKMASNDENKSYNYLNKEIKRSRMRQQDSFSKF